MKSTNEMKWLINHAYLGFVPSYSTALVRMHRNIIWLPKSFTIKPFVTDSFVNSYVYSCPSFAPED